MAVKKAALIAFLCTLHWLFFSSYFFSERQRCAIEVRCLLWFSSLVFFFFLFLHGAAQLRIQRIYWWVHGPGLPYQILGFVNKFLRRIAARQRQFFILRHYVVQAYVELGYFAGLGGRCTEANGFLGSEHKSRRRDSMNFGDIRLQATRIFLFFSRCVCDALPNRYLLEQCDSRRAPFWLAIGQCWKVAALLRHAIGLPTRLELGKLIWVPN